MKDSFKKTFGWFAFATCVVLFTVPSLFPQKEVVQSLSYEMGFNNTVGILLLMLAAAIMFFYGYAKKSQTELLLQLQIRELGSRKLLKTLSIISFSLLIVLAIAYWGVEEGVLQAYWPIHYTEAMKYGWVLYKDVHVIYGALQVLPLHWLRLIGIPAMTAQLLLVALSSVLCLYFTYEILGYLRMPIKEKNTILILSAILFFPYYLGIEGFRYVYTTWFFIKIVQLSSRENNLLLQLVVTASAVAFSVLFSQEYGLCLSVALVIFFILDGAIKKKWVNLLHISLIIVSLGTLVWLLPGMFNAVIYMLGGASSFPYVPSFHLVVLFTSVLMLAWMMGTQTRDIRQNYPILVFELLLFSYLPSVLGRCNPSHVLPIAFFIIVISGIWLIKYYNKTVVMVIYILAFITPFPFIIKTQGGTAIRPAISNVAKHNKWLLNLWVDKKLPGYQSVMNKQQKAEQRELSRSEFLQLLNSSSTVMSFCPDEYYYDFFNENCKYQENFFGQSLSWLANQEQFASVIEQIEVSKPDYLLLPENYKQSWMSYSERGVLNLWFCTYSIAKPYRRYNKALYGPVIDYIENNYQLSSSFEGKSLYGRK